MSGCAIDDHARGEIAIVEIRIRFAKFGDHLVDLVSKDAARIRNQLHERLRFARRVGVVGRFLARPSAVMWPLVCSCCTQEKLRRSFSFAAHEARVRLRTLVVGNNHLVRVDALQQQVDMVEAVIGCGATGGAHVARLLLPVGNNLPAAVVAQMRTEL